MKSKRALVIGAGLSGAVSARLLAEGGSKVTVLERRAHVGGNAYDYWDKGVLAQKYGPHIFHTDSDEVFKFLSRFTQWREYRHTVKAEIDGKFIPLPFNFTSLELCYPRKTAEKIKNKLIAAYGLESRVAVTELLKSADADINKFGGFVYEKVFRGYSAKQWGRPLDELEPEIAGRVPVVLSYADGYFKDKYQFMPSGGFTETVCKILDHRNISVELKSDSLGRVAPLSACMAFDFKPYKDTVVYTGCIDELLRYEFGALPYRSLSFEFFTDYKEYFQPYPVINYPSDFDYTRVTEFKRFTYPSECDSTLVCFEYPEEFKAGAGMIPYYPVPQAQNGELYLKYKKRLAEVKNLRLLGRLARYEYINMDAAVLNALKEFAK